jgi:hypothetical protein
MKTFSNKQNAVRDARKALGPEAIPGTDFILAQADGRRWVWATTDNPSTIERALNAMDAEGPAPDTNEALALPDTPTPLADRRARAKTNVARKRADRAKKADRPAVDSRKPALPAPQVGRSRFDPMDGADAAEAARPAKPAKAAAEKPLGKRAAVQAAAERGVLPEPPDFSAKTHERYRGKLANLVALVKAKDVPALEALAIPTYDSSVAALARYRALALTALKAKGVKATA